MKHEYNILWIEDRPTTVANFDESLTDLLEDNGFKINIQYRTKFSMSDIKTLEERLRNYNPFDFIIFDYDLGASSENGLKVAKELRSTIYTDMIFYSANTSATLRKLLFKDKVDGVFIVRKTNFTDDISPIIQDHIKRMSDINNMRGLLLDEMSQCDAILREVLINKYRLLDNEKKQQQLKKLRKSVKESYTCNLRTKLGYDVKSGGIQNSQTYDKTFEDLLNDNHVIDFDKVRRRIVAIFDISNEANGDFIENSITHELQKLRNIFAHQKAVYNDKTIVLDNKTYDFDKFLDLRKKLIKLKKILNQLL